MAQQGLNSLLDLDSLERIATLIWAYKGDSDLAVKVAMARLAGDVWEKIGGQSELDAARTATILRISTYVKEHPRATKQELTSAIEKEIVAFAEKVKSM